MRYALDSIRLIIRRIGLSLRPSAEDENTNQTDIKLDKALDSMTKAAEKIPDLARKLVEAEKELAKDFETDDKARGNASKAVGEDI
jgi:exonuclease VII small subunit